MKNSTKYLLIALFGVGAFYFINRKFRVVSTMVTAVTGENSLYDFILRVEGERLKAYKDQAGKWTIGIGHLILPNEQYLLSKMITPEESKALFNKDISIAKNAVDNFVKVPLNTNQYNALVSFVFNEGVPAFKGSTLLRKLNAGDYTGAIAEFPRWKYETIDGHKVVSVGLINRRALEQKLFSGTMVA